MSNDAGNWGVEGCWELGESNDAGNWGVEGLLGIGGVEGCWELGSRMMLELGVSNCWELGVSNSNDGGSRMMLGIGGESNDAGNWGSRGMLGIGESNDAGNWGSRMMLGIGGVE